MNLSAALTPASRQATSRHHPPPGQSGKIRRRSLAGHVRRLRTATPTTQPLNKDSHVPAAWPLWRCHRPDTGSLALVRSAARSSGGGGVGRIAALVQAKGGMLGGTPRRITALPRRWPQIRSAIPKKYGMSGPPPGYAQITAGADVDTPLSALSGFRRLYLQVQMIRKEHVLVAFDPNPAFWI